MIAYSINSIEKAPDKNLRLGFSVWARNPPKSYLSTYPKVALEILKNTKLMSVSLCGLVDDMWPRITLSRTNDEQNHISEEYQKKLPELGFQEVYIVSDFVKEDALEKYFYYAKTFNISEFWKLLPKSKKNISETLNITEILSFLWHLYVLDVAIDKFKLTGFMAGIRSEFFYLYARKVLPVHDTYFINTF